MTEQTLTVAQVEAALCIWEWMNEARAVPGEYNSAGQVGAAPWRADMLALWEMVGTSQMRMLAWELAPGIEGLYQSLCTDLGEDELRAVFCAYDWEFIPAVCMALDWTKGGQMQEACYQIGPVELPESVRAAVLAEYHEAKPSARAEWERKARAASVEQWGYGDLIDDHEERTAAALAAGQDPAEFVAWLGEKYDLTPVRGR